MKKLPILITLFSSLLLGGHLSQGQETFPASYESDTDEDSAFNGGRIRANATLDGHAGGHWHRGNAGVTELGEVWHAFSRYRMMHRDLLAKITAADTITWTTGLYQKELGSSIDPENGGLDVDVYVALDPDGRFMETWPGESEAFFEIWDWANELGYGPDYTVKVDTIPASEPMATDEEKDIGNRRIPIDSSAMRIEIDITDAVKGWIEEGLVTESSSIAIGLVQRAWEISDGNGNPNPLRYADPNFGTKRMMVFEVANAYLTTTSGGTSVGPGPFSDYELVDGYVDSGAWMGWVYVEDYPWCFLLDLDKHVYVTEEGGWIYVPK